MEHAKTSASLRARVAEESVSIWLTTRGIVDRVVTSACMVVIAYTVFAITPKLLRQKINIWFHYMIDISEILYY